jgi:hypothetical protein
MQETAISSKQSCPAFCLNVAGFLLFDPEDGGNTFLSDVSGLLLKYTVL